MPHSHAANLPPPCCSSAAAAAWVHPTRLPLGAQHLQGHPGCAPHALQQWRGYKSSRKPLKPLNTAASWKALRSVFPPPSPAVSPSSSSSPLVDTCIPPIPAVPKPPTHVRVGRITGRYSLELQPAFAVVEIGGTQFKVTRDDVLFVNQLQGTDINDVLCLGRVLLLGSRTQTVVGRPYVPGASVLVAVEEHFKDGKVHVFKKTARKRYRKYRAARPQLTTLRVLEVRGVEAEPPELAAVGTTVAQELPVEWDADALGEGQGDEEEAVRVAR